MVENKKEYQKIDEPSPKLPRERVDGDVTFSQMMEDGVRVARGVESKRYKDKER